MKIQFKIFVFLSKFQIHEFLSEDSVFNQFPILMTHGFDSYLIDLELCGIGEIGSLQILYRSYIEKTTPYIIEN